MPVLALDSGELIPESAAILLFLAEGTDFLPSDRLERARVHQWLFFEQNQVEAGARGRALHALTGQVPKKPEVFADRLRQGRNALRSLDRGLVDEPSSRRALHGRRHRAYGYVHCAADAGAELREYPRIAAWLDRVEATPGFVNDLEPIVWTDN